jgi:signal transduction histidine kinase
LYDRCFARAAVSRRRFSTQRLVSLVLTLRLAREKLDTEPGETGRLLDRSREELDRALRELRDLARGIHPAVLADRGLGAAVEALAERAPLPVEVVSELPDRRLPEKVELIAYIVVSETLTNIEQRLEHDPSSGVG